MLRMLRLSTGVQQGDDTVFADLIFSDADVTVIRLGAREANDVIECSHAPHSTKVTHLRGGGLGRQAEETVEVSL